MIAPSFPYSNSQTTDSLLPTEGNKRKQAGSKDITAAWLRRITASKITCCISQNGQTVTCHLQSYGMQQVTLFATCPGLKLPWVLCKILQRPETRAEAGACVANIVVLWLT